MRVVIALCFLALFLINCRKPNINKVLTGCDIEQVRKDNAKKVTISSGVWGTLSSTEGDCMPMAGPGAGASCKTCPVQRTLKIFQYTLLSNATSYNNSPVFFDSFNSPLVAQVDADENGFFQISIPPGHYSAAIVENGKLYANSLDGQGGLNSFTVTGGLQNINFGMTYKAVF